MANYRNSLKAGTNQGVPRKAASGPQHPRWDAERRELWWGDLLLKRFAKSAPNQERLLAAFEAAGWLHPIPDPLLQAVGILPQDRLKGTCKQLNLGIKGGFLKFGGDGKGGVSWRIAAPGGEENSPKTPPAKPRKQSRKR